MGSFTVLVFGRHRLLSSGLVPHTSTYSIADCLQSQEYKLTTGSRSRFRSEILVKLIPSERLNYDLSSSIRHQTTTDDTIKRKCHFHWALTCWGQVNTRAAWLRIKVREENRTFMQKKLRYSVTIWLCGDRSGHTNESPVWKSYWRFVIVAKFVLLKFLNSLTRTLLLYYCALDTHTHVLRPPSN